MSRRFGRNQRRRAREQLAELNRTLDVMAACYAIERQRSDNLCQQQRNAQQRYEALRASLYHDPVSNTVKVDEKKLPGGAV